MIYFAPKLIAFLPHSKFRVKIAERESNSMQYNKNINPDHHS